MMENVSLYCAEKYFGDLLKRVPVDRLLCEVEEMRLDGAQRAEVDEVRSWLDEARVRWMAGGGDLCDDDLLVLKEGMVCRYEVLRRIQWVCLQVRVRRLEGEVVRLKGDFMPWVCYGISAVCLIGVVVLAYYVVSVYSVAQREASRMDSLQEGMILKRIR